MNADGKIYIIVTDKMPTGGNAAPNPEPKKAKKSQEEILLHWTRGKLINTAKNLATTAVNFAFHNIGNFTGDYITQMHVNNAISTLNSFANIFKSGYAGFKVGGVPGLVLGAALSVINETASSVYNVIDLSVQNRKTNYEIEQLRNRTGLNSAINGSRGTEN